jgi:hypothetical protein
MARHRRHDEKLRLLDRLRLVWPALGEMHQRAESLVQDAFFHDRHLGPIDNRFGDAESGLAVTARDAFEKVKCGGYRPAHIGLGDRIDRVFPKEVCCIRGRAPRRNGGVVHLIQIVEQFP